MHLIRIRDNHPPTPVVAVDDDDLRCISQNTLCRRLDSGVHLSEFEAYAPTAAPKSRNLPTPLVAVQLALDKSRG